MDLGGVEVEILNVEAGTKEGDGGS